MKSRQILKCEYDELGIFLCDEYIKKQKLLDKKNKAEKKITDIMSEELPELVREAYKKYPEYFTLQSRDVQDVLYFIDATELRYDKTDWNYHSNIVNLHKYYNDSAIKFANDIYSTLKQMHLENQYTRSYWGYNSRLSGIFSFKFKGLEITRVDDNDRYNNRKDINIVCAYIDKHPEVGEILKSYIIEVCKYNKFRKDISCAFGTITTTNMLKNEIPEAYEFFYSKWGKKYEKQDEEEKNRKKADKKAQCDKIEALRASIS